MKLIVKIVVVLGILGLAGLTGYAYLADFAPEQGVVTKPVVLDGR